jgi:hypothetical protein
MKTIIRNIFLFVMALGVNAQEFSHSGYVYDGNEIGVQNIEVQLHIRNTSSYEITNPSYSNFNYVGGTSVTGCDDCVQGPFNIGFTFNYFGNNYTQFYASSNGWIGFSPGQTNGYVAQFLPNGSAPKNAIIADWEDLFPSTGQMNYYVSGTSPNRRMIFNYNSVPFYGCRSTVVTWQIVLHETTNKIDINMISKPLCGGSGATMGLTNIDGTRVVPVGGKNAVAWSINQPTSYSFTPSQIQTDFTLNRTVKTDLNGRYIFSSTGLDINNYQFKIIVPKPTTLSNYTISEANHITDIVLGRRTTSSRDFYRSDLNNDGKITISDSFLLFSLVSGLKNNTTLNLSSKFFNQTQWNTIKTSSINLKPTILGLESFEITSPTNNGITNLYLLTMGFSNKTKLTY